MNTPLAGRASTVVYSTWQPEKNGRAQHLQGARRLGVLASGRHPGHHSDRLRSRRADRTGRRRDADAAGRIDCWSACTFPRRRSRDAKLPSLPAGARRRAARDPLASSPRTSARNLDVQQDDVVLPAQSATARARCRSKCRSTSTSRIAPNGEPRGSRRGSTRSSAHRRARARPTSRYLGGERAATVSVTGPAAGSSSIPPRWRRHVAVRGSWPSLAR